MLTLYEDLSYYENVVEDVAPVTSPVINIQTTKLRVRAWKARPPKDKRTTKITNNEAIIDTKAFVVHGTPCQSPMANTTQDVRKACVRGIVGAIGGQRRAAKATSSVVIFLDIPISFPVRGGQAVIQVWLPI